MKPSRDVSTAAKCSWKSREASLKPFKARLRHQTVSLCSWSASGGSTYTGSSSGMGVFTKATLTSPNKMVKSFDTAIVNTFVTSSPRSLRPENLRTVSPRNAMSLVLVVWTRLCRSPHLSELPGTRENFTIHVRRSLDTQLCIRVTRTWPTVRRRRSPSLWNETLIVLLHWSDFVVGSTTCATSIGTSPPGPELSTNSV